MTRSVEVLKACTCGHGVPLGHGHFAGCEMHLSKVFTSWSPSALAETVALAQKSIVRHGTIAKARNSIAELSGGNVSLQCRAHFQPIDHVLAAMERGYGL